MARVTGVGGVFLRSADPKALGEGNQAVMIVATGETESHFHRFHRRPLTHPTAPGRFSALAVSINDGDVPGGCPSAGVASFRVGRGSFSPRRSVRRAR